MSTEINSLDELSEACERDPMVLWAAQDLNKGHRVWTYGGAVVVAAADLSQRDRLVVRGPFDGVVVLVTEVLEELGPTYRPMGDAHLIHELVERVAGLQWVDDFGWMAIDATAQYGSTVGPERKSSTVWLVDAHRNEVSQLIELAFPTSYAKPGVAGVECWAGTWSHDGNLVAIGADAWSCPMMDFISGLATHPEYRSQGFGTETFCFLLDELLLSHPAVGLLVDSSNDRTRALYRSLGMSWRAVAAARQV